MRSNNIYKLSFLIALVLALGAGIIVISAMAILSMAISYALATIVALATFATSFFLIHSSIENFIHAKIKLIYRSINQFKAMDDSRRQVSPHLSLDRVKMEVEAWGEARSKEIEEYKKREAFRREFIGNLAHELRTPIFNIQGYVETLLEGAVEDPKYNMRYLERAQRSVDRLINLVTDLDEISKLESGSVELKLGRFNLQDLVKETLDSFSDQAKDRKISLKLKPVADRPVWVRADPSRIRQVMDNLLNNAIKYGVEGGNVEINFTPMDKDVQVEVANDGPGIPKEHLPRLFERFYRVDSSRSREVGGSGLGLAIVKHIVESHGSSISVTSDSDDGTIFAFNLPSA